MKNTLILCKMTAVLSLSFLCVMPQDALSQPHSLEEAAVAIRDSGFPSSRSDLSDAARSWPHWVRSLLIAMDSSSVDGLVRQLNQNFPSWRTTLSVYDDAFRALKASPYTQGSRLADRFASIQGSRNLTAYGLMGNWKGQGLDVFQLPRGDEPRARARLEDFSAPRYERLLVECGTRVIPSRLLALAPDTRTLAEREYLRWELAIVLFEMAYPGYLKSLTSDSILGQVNMGRTALMFSTQPKIQNEDINAGRAFNSLFDPTWRVAHSIRNYFQETIEPYLLKRPLPWGWFATGAVTATGAAWVAMNWDTCVRLLAPSLGR